MQIPILHVESNTAFNSTHQSQVTGLNTHRHRGYEDIPWLVVHNLNTWKLPILHHYNYSNAIKNHPILKIRRVDNSSWQLSWSSDSLLLKGVLLPMTFSCHFHSLPWADSSQLPEMIKLVDLGGKSCNFLFLWISSLLAYWAELNTWAWSKCSVWEKVRGEDLTKGTR